MSQKIENIPPWLLRACEKGSQEYLSMKVLKPYGLDVSLPLMPGHAIPYLMFLLDPGHAQYAIDHNWTEDGRMPVWELLHSWGIGCSLARLELRTSDVWRVFEDNMVVPDGPFAGMLSVEGVIPLFMEDVADIRNNWPDEAVPGYETLSPYRTHLHTFMHMCIEYKHEYFAELWPLLAGPPPKVKHIENAPEIRIALREAGKKCTHKRHVDGPQWVFNNEEPNRSLMEVHLAQLAVKDRQHEKRKRKKRQARKRQAKRKRVARVLAERNANFDETSCVICLDVPSNICFEPCKHVCCCQDCAALLQKCCLCRQSIDDRQLVQPPEHPEAPVPSKPVRKLSRAQAAARARDFDNNMTPQQSKDSIYDLLRGIELSCAGKNKSDKNGKKKKKNKNKRYKKKKRKNYKRR